MKVNMPLNKETKLNQLQLTEKNWRNPYGAVANVLDCDMVVSEFVLQSRHCVHFFKLITLEKLGIP